ncbi:PPOX class F420-dependent enzyme [Virgisporangium aliadipatigenens]|uniref:PPOX class F420-dependent enzyme n=1 Tax=Virgisporangium aliadipatigenens TaxID=741659 RepID=A0A8J3YGV2_9ACTN|nr:TIGR03618 family F420-dependent PPOX class oxidoreductase [Virgisporangium aliadipatigenens]GIJ44959.1 PPOX class F420-dependent enzyme [Virgisporangium aliadipatigenens]
MTGIRQHAVDPRSEEFTAFWAERHLATLTTPRPDGSPHVVPVGVTFDVDAGLARIIASAGTRKVRNVVAAGPEGARVAVCSVDGRRWVTVEGRATVSSEPAAVAEAVRRYALRYREPRPNPERVVIEIAATRIIGLL